MQYDVVVSLIFATERIDGDLYDVWEIHTLVEANRPKAALLDAIPLLKSFEDWKKLGYPEEPILYGVRSVRRQSRLGVVAGTEPDQSRLCILVGTINEQQVKSLRSFDTIQLPYGFMHIG